MSAVPSEVVFAQKATAIVKAAGMDPRLIDLETFRNTATFIFCKAYIAIFKEHLLSDSDSFNERMGKDEQMLNSQLVIDGLYAKTNNSVLTHITGEDIYSGNHRAIGALVGILFAEGQRMWQKKMKMMQEMQEKQAAEERAQRKKVAHADDSLTTNTLDSNSDVVLKPHAAVLDPEDAYPPIIVDNDIDSEVELSGNGLDRSRNTHLQESLQSLKQLQTSTNVPPKELEKLLRRIEYLESLVKKQRKNSNSQKVKLVRKKERERDRQTTYYDNDSGDDSEVYNNRRRDEPRYVQNRAIDNDRHIERHEKVQKVVEEGRRSRPSSAPSSRRTPQPSNSHRSHYPAEEAARKQQQSSPQNTPRVPRVWGNAVSTGNMNMNSELYTYDMKSGRRIPVSQAEFQAEERRRKKEAMGNIKALADMDEALMNSARVQPSHNNNNFNGDQVSGPTRAEWPGKSTGRSAEEWVQRMRKIRGESDGDPSGNADIPPARYYGAYQKLEKTDLVISVEHCWNCEHHKVSLRHDPAQYVSVSDTFLRSLAQVAHKSGIKARVGVSRFKADVTPKSKVSDVDSRVGSCEIQVAYKSTSGEVVSEVLHSKLLSQRWPSKTVVEKRLQAFLSKLDIPTHDLLLPTKVPSLCSENCAAPYPVGLCLWKDTPLDSAGWTFVPPANPAALRVQWVFDYRSMDEMDLPRCQIGAIVRVSGVIFKGQALDGSSPRIETPRDRESKPQGGRALTAVERFPLAGVVREYVSHANGISIRVRLKYSNEEVEVAESQCLLEEDFEEVPVELSSVSQVPLALDTLFHLARKLDLLRWMVVESAGDNEDFSRKEVYLSRASFFSQVRNISWEVERKLQLSGRVFAHPSSGEVTDIQLSYGEETMQWVFNYYGRLANVTAFEKMVLKLHKEAATDSSAKAVPGAERKKEEKKPLAEATAQPLNAVAEIAELKSEQVAKDEAKADRETKPQEAKVGTKGTSLKDSLAAMNKSLATFDAALAKPSYPQPDSARARATPREDKKDSSPRLSDEPSIAPTKVNHSSPRIDPSTSNSPSVPSAVISIRHSTEKASIDEPVSTPAPVETPVPTTAAAIATVSDQVSPGREAKASPKEPQSPEPVLGRAISSQKYDLEAFESDLEDEASMDTIPAKLPTDAILMAPAPVPVPVLAPVAAGPVIPVLTITEKDEKESAPTEKTTARQLASSSSAASSARSEKKQSPTAVESAEADRSLSALTYQSKDLVFISIIVEGEALEHEHYDTAQVILDINDSSFVASVCLARERGSKRRSFNVNWGDIFVPADSFSSASAVLSLVITDQELLRQCPHLPSASARGGRDHSHSTAIPLHRFMKSYFEVTVRVTVPSELDGRSGAVTATIHGHAHEAKESRTSRIMSMRPQDLLSVKFDPLPSHDAVSEDEYSDDLEEPEEDSGGRRKGPSSSLSRHGQDRDFSQSQRELTKSLFPKASHHNLLSSIN